MASVLHLGMIRAPHPFRAWADRAEDISRGGSLVVGAASDVHRALGAQPAGDLVLLADAGLVPANQTSMAAGSTPFSRPISSRRARKLF